jgi:hypothetical protein
MFKRNIKEYIQNYPIETYSTFTILILTIIIILFHLYTKLTSIDGTREYIQYYL